MESVFFGLIPQPHWQNDMCLPLIESDQDFCISRNELKNEALEKGLIDNQVETVVDRQVERMRFLRFAVNSYDGTECWL
jgi:hypothetical protein